MKESGLWKEPRCVLFDLASLTVLQSPSFFPCLSAVIRDALLWRPVRERDVITARLAQEVIIPPEGADVSNCAARTRRSSGLHTPHKVRLRPGERHR